MGSLVVRVDDGETRVVDEIDERGKVICTSHELSPSNPVFVAEQAAAAAEQARLDKLHKLLDASKPDPASVADVVVILKALAFGDVTKSNGDAVAAEALPVDPKGGLRG